MPASLLTPSETPFLFAIRWNPAFFRSNRWQLRGAGRPRIPARLIARFRELGLIEHGTAANGMRTASLTERGVHAICQIARSYR